MLPDIPAVEPDGVLPVADPVPVPVALPVPVPVGDPVVPLLDAIVPVTSTLLFTYFCRSELSPPCRRKVFPAPAELPVEPGAPVPLVPVPAVPALLPDVPLAVLAFVRTYCACDPLCFDVVSPVAAWPLLGDDCRHPVTVTDRELGSVLRCPAWPVAPDCPGCCAPTPTAITAASIVPNMNCRFIRSLLNAAGHPALQFGLCSVPKDRGVAAGVPSGPGVAARAID